MWDKWNSDNSKEKYDTLNDTVASKKEEIKLYNKNTSNYKVPK